MKKVVHIIEDDRDILYLLGTICNIYGYEAFCDYNGNEFSNGNTPDADIYFLDVQLIGKSGADICKTVKQKNSNIPVVLVSASINLQNIAAECGADAIIYKPFEMKQVASTLKELVKN